MLFNILCSYRHPPPLPPKTQNLFDGEGKEITWDIAPFVISLSPQSSIILTSCYLFLKKKKIHLRDQKRDKQRIPYPRWEENTIEGALPWFVEAKPLDDRIKGVSMLGMSKLLFSLAYPHKKDEG